MPHLYRLLAGPLCLLALLAGPPAHAQAPAWDAAAISSRLTTSGSAYIRAMTTDASGNVYVTGEYGGGVYFGTILLPGSGLFVAKYVPATDTWAWAYRGGGTRDAYATSIAVHGTSVYVGANIINTSTNDAGVTLEGGAGSSQAVPGRSATFSYDMVLAKYQDNGSSATLGWVQTIGGNNGDELFGVAVSGSSVYVTGSFLGDYANSTGVTIGDASTPGGPRPVRGASPAGSTDLLLAKYTDNGSSATLGWVQVAGGTSTDVGFAVAASGNAVYVTGSLSNTTANANSVVLDGDGTTAGTRSQYGASPTTSEDLLLVKYQDDGPTASFMWSQVAGGSGRDQGRALAVSGSSVYVTGFCFNSATNATGVVLGGSGAVPGTGAQAGAGPTRSTDMVLAKYQDNGSSAIFRWSQTGGGTGDDFGNAVAVSGNSVYVTGALANTNANANAVTFGGAGLVPGTTPVPGMDGTDSRDWVLARYTDNGTTGTYNWARVGGGHGDDYASGVVVRGQQVLVGGSVQPSFAFGATTVTAGPNANDLGVLASLTDPALTPLPTRAAGTGPALALYPNPASGGAAQLTGATPGAAVQVLDALGRVATTATVAADGTARLAGLAPGLYLVRCGPATGRLAVE